MRLIGLMPVRNEEWCLGLSARVALQWCDGLAVGLHACTDASESIIEQIAREGRGGDITTLTFCGAHWDEMRQRQGLLESAREMGATHIAMIDADEVLTANLLGGLVEGNPAINVSNRNIRDYISGLVYGQMLELPGYNLRGSLDRYHSNGIWGKRWFSLAFKDNQCAHWSGDKFHSREPEGILWHKWRPIKQGEGGVMHLWGASERRLQAKHALYKVTERLRWPTKPVNEIERLYNLWRDAREPWEYADVPDGWWEHKDAITLHAAVQPTGEPWQETEVRRLVAAHGRDKFHGLDLFGLV